jgi:hypothetical protein
MVRDVAIMFDELKALADRHAELHHDRARLQAESEQRTRELAACAMIKQQSARGCLTNSSSRVAKWKMSALIPAV